MGGGERAVLPSPLVGEGVAEGDGRGVLEGMRRAPRGAKHERAASSWNVALRPTPLIRPPLRQAQGRTPSPTRGEGVVSRYAASTRPASQTPLRQSPAARHDRGGGSALAGTARPPSRWDKIPPPGSDRTLRGRFYVPTRCWSSRSTAASMRIRTTIANATPS
jgi:hypothetical protein